MFLDIPRLFVGLSFFLPSFLLSFLLTLPPSLSLQDLMKPHTFYMTKAGFQLLTLLSPPGIQMHTTHTTSGFLLAPVTFFIFLACCPCLRIFPVLSLISQGMWLISGCGQRNGASLLGLWPSGEASRVFPIKHILQGVLGQYLSGWRKLSNLWAFIPQGI